MLNLTYHARVERMDRIIYILTSIGLGVPVAEKFWEHSQTKCVLTNTGVMIVYSKEDTIITMYLVTVQEAHKMICTKVLPQTVYNRILKNIKAGYLIKQNTVRY